MNRLILLFFLFLFSACQLTNHAQKNDLKSKYHVDIAIGYMKHNKNPEAISELNQAIELNPKNAEAHHQLAICLYQRGRAQESIDSFKTSLLVNPKATNVRNDFVTVLLEQRKYVDAYKNALISVNDLTYTAPAQSYFLKAQAALKLSTKSPRLLQIAQESFQSTLNFYPNHCGALYHLGDIYLKKQQLKKSYVLYHKSLEQCQLPEDKLKSLNALIPLSKKFGLVYQWGRYKQLQSQLAKKPKNQH
jgi:type IV pilus assembly protein PilF